MNSTPLGENRLVDPTLHAVCLVRDTSDSIDKLLPTLATHTRARSQAFATRRYRCERTVQILAVSFQTLRC